MFEFGGIKDAFSKALGLSSKDSFSKTQKLMDSCKGKLERVTEKIKDSNSLLPGTVYVFEEKMDVEFEKYNYLINRELSNNMISLNVKQAINILDFYSNCYEMFKSSSVNSSRYSSSNEILQGLMKERFQKNEVLIKSSLQNVVRLLDVESFPEFETKFNEQYGSNFPVEIRQEILKTREDLKHSTLET